MRLAIILTDANGGVLLTIEVHCRHVRLRGEPSECFTVFALFVVSIGFGERLIQKE